MPLGFAAITERTPVIAYLGLGANLGDPRGSSTGSEAPERRGRSGSDQGFRLLPEPAPGAGKSALVCQCRGPGAHPPGPEELLRLLQQVETAMGRVRGERWGPRVIDLECCCIMGK